MWLTSSSIGRKFVMAVTGICLVLFVTFHVLMNTVAIAWPTAYNVICEFLGANWYALIASMGLAVLLILHIIYASWLTILNRKARGNDRYAVTSRPPQVEWSSKNMYVLGIVILAFLVVHLIQFWARMQWQEIRGTEYTVSDTTYAPLFGTLFIQEAFKLVWTPIVYIIGFIALWFHMNHGFWSMLHSVGWDNNHWIERLKCIGFWWTSIVVGLFCAQAIVFTVQAKNDHYTTDPKLQAQYAEYYGEKAQEIIDEFQSGQMQLAKMPDQQAAQAAFNALINETMEKLGPVVNNANTLCPDATTPELEGAKGMYQQMVQYQQMMGMPQGAPAPGPGPEVDDIQIEEDEEVVTPN